MFWSGAKLEGMATSLFLQEGVQWSYEVYFQMKPQLID